MRNKKTKSSLFYQLTHLKTGTMFGFSFLFLGILASFIGIYFVYSSKIISFKAFSEQFSICDQLYPNPDTVVPHSSEYLQLQQCRDQANTLEASYHQNVSSYFIAVAGISIGIAGILLSLNTSSNWEIKSRPRLIKKVLRKKTKKV
jgi:hypothetical protein